MMVAELAALALLLWPASQETPDEAALVAVESQGNTWAVGSRGERGRWQALPVSACARFGLPGHARTSATRQALCRAQARRVAWLLHVPKIGQAAGRGVLARYRARCAAQARGRPRRQAFGIQRCAVAAYNAGAPRWSRTDYLIRWETARSKR